MPPRIWRILERLRGACATPARGRRRPRRGEVSLGLLRLEDRRVLSADPLAALGLGDDPATVTIDAGMYADDGQADTFRIVRHGDEAHVLVNDELIFSGAAADVSRLRIVGSSDDDRLLLDFSGGALQTTIVFDAGGSQANGDSIVLTGGAVGSAAWTLHGDGAGIVEIDGWLVSFRGVEQAEDGLDAGQRRIQTEALAGDVWLVGAADPGGLRLATADGFELAFAAPGQSLSVETAGSLGVSGTIEIAGGDVRLDAGSEGVLLVSGTIDVSSDDPGASGGRVELLGRYVGLIGEARVDASGAAGGGTVLVGGDYQGLNPAVRNAERTYVGAGVTIAADAIEHGDGGRVIVWADDVAQFHGTITARGGAAGGDGGFVETSGKQTLIFRGDVDLSAVLGARGTLLLDPDTIEIVGGAGPQADDGELDADTPNPGDPEGSIFFADGPGAAFTISEEKLESLNADIVLEATSRIFVSGTFDHDADGAGGDDPGLNVVLINGSLTLRTRNDVLDGTDGIDLTAGGTLDNLEFRTTGGGTITIETGTGATPQAADVRLGLLTAGGGGGITVTASGTITVAGVLTAEGAAPVSLSAGGDIVMLDGSEIRSDEGDITLSAAGDVWLSLVNADADGGGAAGTVSIVADADGSGGGAILDNTAAEAPLIIAAAAELRAGSGIGDEADPLELSVGTLAATTVTGDIAVWNATALVVDMVLGTSGLSITGGAAGDDIYVTVDAAALTVNETISNPTGDITLAAADMTLANDAISLGGGTLTLDAAGGSIDVTTDPGAEITASGDVVLIATNIGATNGGLDITGDGSGGGTLTLTVTPGAGTVVLDVLTDQFSAVVVTLQDAAADVSVDLPGGDEVLLSGAGGVSTVQSVVTTNLGATLDVRLIEAGSDLVLGTGAVTAGADVIFQSGDDILVGDAAGTAVSAGPGVSVTLVADSDSDGTGAILDGGGTLALGGGALRLVAGSGIGAAADPIEVTGLTDFAASTQTGGIFVRNSSSGDVNVTSVTTFGQTTTGVTAGSGAIHLTNAAGTISAALIETTGGTDDDDIVLVATWLEVNTLIAAGDGDVSLTATVGDIDDADANSSITADSITLWAAGGIGLTNAINTDSTGTLSLTTAGVDGAGNVSVVEANALDTSRLSVTTHASEQVVSITSGGTITVDAGLGDVGDHLALTGTSIEGGPGTLFANDLSLTATVGGIGVATAVNSDTLGFITLSTAGVGAAGDIQLIEVNPIPLSFLSVSTHASTQTISITVTTGPDAFTVDADFGDAADNLRLIATDGDIAGGVGTLIAAELRLEAATGGIGTGTAVNTDTTGTLTLISGGAGAAGNISVAEVNALDTSRVSVTTHATEQLVAIASGAVITVDGDLGDAGDDLSLTGTSIEGGAGTLTAKDLTLVATVGGIGAATAVNTDTSGTITLSTAGADAAGDIQLVEANALPLSRVNVTTHATAQTVSLTSTAGPITVDVNFGNSTDHLSLTATNGDIATGGGTLTADNLTLAATAGGIGIGTAVLTDTTGTITLSTGGLDSDGNISIVETNALDTSRITFSTEAGSEQLVSITSTSGPITVDADLGNTGDDLVLVASAGDIEGGAGTLFANDLTLHAVTGGIGLVTPVNTETTGTLTLISGAADADGNISVVEANALDTSRLSVTTHASEQLVSITSGGTITVDANLGNATDDLSLTGTSIEGGAGTLTANDLTLTATVGGISGGTAVNTNTTGTLSLNTAGIGAAGDIAVVEANALPTSRVVLTTDASQQTVSLTSTAGPITVDADLGDAADNLVLVASSGNIVGGAGTLTADALTLEATLGGIGIGTPVNTETTGALTLITGGAGAAGNVTVVEANALDTARLSFTTAADQQVVNITSTGGLITIGGNVGNATDDLILTADEIEGGAGTLTADNLTLTATVGGIGATTAVNTDTSGTITLSTAGANAAGDIQIVEANALPLSRLDVTTAASAQTVSLTSTAGSITVDVNFGNSTDHLALTATNGNIVGGAGTLTAADLTLTGTSGGIGIGTAVRTDTTGTITLSTGGVGADGNISLIEANALDTSRITFTTDGGSEQLVSITSTAGPITVDADLGNTGDDLVLVASAGDIEGGAGTLFAHDLTLHAVLGGIGLVTPVNTETTGTLTLISGGTDADGNISVVEANALETSRLSVTTHASEQLVSITSGGTITVDANLGNTTDDLSLTGTSIEDGAGTLTANDLTLTATTGGIGVGTAVSTNTTGMISLNTGGVGAAGDIDVVEANALPTSRVVLTTDASQQTVSLTSTAGPITVDADLGDAGDNLVLVASSGNIVGGAGTLTADALTLEATLGGIGIGTVVNTETTGSLTLITGGAGAAGNVTVVEANALDTARLSFTTAADQQVVNITSTGGLITIGGNVGNATDDLILTADGFEGGAGTLTANDLTLTATVGGIGVTTAVNTDTSGAITLSTAGANAAGDIQIVEANALPLSRVDVTTAATAQTVSLTSTAGPITVDVNFGNSTDHLALTATNGNIVGGGGTLTADDLTLTATSGGIGIGGTVLTDTTGTITLSTGGLDSDGNISLIEANSLDTSRITFTTDGGSEQLVSITSTSGPITVNADLGNTGDSLVLVASAGDIEGGAGTLFAHDLTLHAVTGGIGLVTPVNVSITGCLTLITGGSGSDGDIHITSDSSLTICEITTDPDTEQTVTITTSGSSDLVINEPINSSSDRVLVSGGSIYVNADVSAPNLTLQAEGIVQVADGARLIGGGDGTALIIVAHEVVLGEGATPELATVTNTGTGTISITATGGDITLANNSISIDEGLLTLAAAGSILSTTDAGTEISADGDVTLIATSIGPTNGGLDFTGDGSGDSTLTVIATAGSGDVNLDWSTDQFNSIVLILEDADTDVNITFPAGDHIEVRGETTTGLAGTSTVHSLSTTGLAATLHLELTAAGADLLLRTGAIALGAEACFLSADDIVVGDGPGTVIVAGAGVDVTLIADSDGDGSGAIVDGGGSIAMNGGGLRLTAGSGIGAAGSPIRTTNLGDVAAYTATGGIYLLNTGSGDVNVTTLTTCGGTTAGLTADAGNVEVANTAGAIVLSEAIAAPTGAVRLDAATSVLDNHAGGSDVIAQTLTLITGTGVASAADPLDTAVGALTFANGTGDVSVVNDASAVPGAAVTVSGTSTGTGTVSLTEIGGDLVVGAADIVTSSGAVVLTATAADAAIVLAAGSDIVTTGGGTAGAAVTLIADNMDLAGSIVAGTGVVTLAASDPAQTVEVGTGAADGAASLGLTPGELSGISTSGGLVIGSSTSTGGLIVVGPLDLTGSGLTGGALTLLSGPGGIDIDAALVSPVDFAAATDGGDIRFGAAGVVNAGANLVLLTAVGGAIEGHAAAFTNVIARGLAAAATDGIGGTHAIETNIGTLAALNTTTGDIHIANDSGGAALTIGTVAGLTGVTNTAPAATGGNITITNTGPILVMADVLATGGGSITLTASTGGDPLAPVPTNVQISARVHATGGHGNVTLNSESGRTVINNAVAGPEVRVTGLGEVLGTFGVIFNGGATISTATGDVGSQTATLRNVTAQPVDILGFTSVSGSFGDPGDFGFTIRADFSVTPVQAQGFGSPGNFLFEQFFAKSPNANPADPITITVTLTRNARVRIVDNVVVVVVQAPVPGEGFGAQFFEFEQGAPQLAAAELRIAPVVLTAETTTPVFVQTQEFRSAAIEQHVNMDERELILRVLRRDGSLQENIVFRGQEVETILDDLQGFFASLPDGRYRLLLKEPGRQRLRLVRDVTLENGVPRSDIAHEAGGEETLPVSQESEDEPPGVPGAHAPASESNPGVPAPGLVERRWQPPTGDAVLRQSVAALAAAGLAVGGRFEDVDRLMERLGRTRRLAIRGLSGRLSDTGDRHAAPGTRASHHALREPVPFSDSH